MNRNKNDAEWIHSRFNITKCIDDVKGDWAKKSTIWTIKVFDTLFNSVSANWLHQWSVEFFCKISVIVAKFFWNRSQHCYTCFFFICFFSILLLLFYFKFSCEIELSFLLADVLLLFWNQFQVNTNVPLVKTRFFRSLYSFLFLSCFKPGLIFWCTTMIVDSGIGGMLQKSMEIGKRIIVHRIPQYIFAK